MAKGKISSSLGSSGYSFRLAGGSSSYSLSSGLSRGYAVSAGGYCTPIMSKDKAGYTIKSQLYSQVNLFPVPYGRIPDPLDELLRMYRKKCSKCGRESRESISASHYSFN